MKRKIASILAVLCFGVGILGLSVNRSAYRPKTSLAAASLKFEVLPVEEASVSPQPKVDYYLVYPGILPDHLLYKVKMVRDRVSILLTTDLKQKAEKQLLYADKRLGAGKALIEGNKVPLGLTTFWKAEKYLSETIDTLLIAKQKGLETGDLTEKVTKASQKHFEVLSEFDQKLNGEGKTAVEEIVSFWQGTQEKLAGL